MNHFTAAIPVLPADRQPLQSRSRASLNRMLSAAQRLLVERESDDFALSDVSRIGRVSIGSIYHRFQSKEELLRAVHRKLMEELHDEQSVIVRHARDIATDLSSLVAVLVEEIAEFMKRNARALRPMMACANKDAVISAVGKASHNKLKDLFIVALLSYRTEIRHADPKGAAETCFKMIYAAVARDLGFEAAHIAAEESEWGGLKANLFAMCTAFLVSPPKISFAAAMPAKAQPRPAAVGAKKTIRSGTGATRRSTTRTGKAA